MLIYFKTGNYKSIKDPVVINFNAAALSEHQESNIYIKGKTPLLKTVLLYGPNASGKSKILDAFVFFRWSIVNSATDKQSNEAIDTEPFLLDIHSQDQPSFFEAEFIIQKTKYRYGFEADSKAVRKEWLLEVKATTSQPLFLRIGQEFQINEHKLPEGKGLDKRTRKNALFLSVAAQWNVKQAEQISEWFDSIYTVHGMMDRNYKLLTTSMLNESDNQASVNNLMRKADLGINSLHTLDVGMENELWPVFASHNVYDGNGNVVGETPFPLSQKESEGTQKFYNLAGVFLKAVAAGRLVVIDEMDARLHTMLTKAIIHLFNSGELKTEAQLFAVSHDVALLDKELLRRDQIYFVEKDGFGATKVATLAEYKARKEAPYYKNYLEGKYGAIPFIEDLESVLTNGEEE